MKRGYGFFVNLAGCIVIESGCAGLWAESGRNRKVYQTIDMRGSGIRMRQLFAKAGYDVKEIQRFLRLSCPQPIYRWIKGQTLPTVDHLFMLSKLLGIHMEDFLVEKMKTETAGTEELIPVCRAMAYYFRAVCALAAGE